MKHLIALMAFLFPVHHQAPPPSVVTVTTEPAAAPAANPPTTKPTPLTSSTAAPSVTVITIVANTVSTGLNITVLSGNAGALAIGDIVAGPGIPAGATITGLFPSSYYFLMSQPATQVAYEVTLTITRP